MAVHRSQMLGIACIYCNLHKTCTALEADMTSVCSGPDVISCPLAQHVVLLLYLLCSQESNL